MAVPLRLLAVISVQRLHTVADLMVGLHPHLRMVEGVRLPMAVAVLCLCRRMAGAGLQLRRTVGEGRHLTAVAVTPVVDSVVAVTPAVGLVAAVAQADSAAEVATYRQEAGAITVVVAEVTGTAKLISKNYDQRRMPPFGGILFSVPHRQLVPSLACPESARWVFAADQAEVGIGQDLFPLMPRS
jgi:hypothetical protein